MARLLTTPAMLRDYLEEKGWDYRACQLDYLDTLQLLFPIRLSSYYADLINWNDPEDPLRLIAIPQPDEQTVGAHELADPIGDQAREVVPGLIHRYPDRCLLLLTTQCRIHCRFCFRRDVVGKSRPIDLPQIKTYLQTHQEISEVILSGGDPFTIPLTTLRNLFDVLTSISHIQRIRFHTRVPVIDPESVSEPLLQLLAALPQQVVVALHINHIRELTPPVQQLARRLHADGALLVSQTVLLQGVNDSVKTLQTLFSALTNTGIKPYYLHHLDQAMGTSHFRLPITDGLDLYHNLSRRLSKLSLPEYVLDLPGGWGKVPVNQLQQQSDGSYTAVTFEGKTIQYADPAAQPLTIA